MLVEIYCEKFFQKYIYLVNGLNIIAGDSNGTNSIGKTTMLYIIDYIFGGDSYLEKCDEVIDKIGHHKISFTFNFDSILLYFSRSTDEKHIIQYSDQYKTIMNTFSKEEYTKKLKAYYNLVDIDDTFRNIMTRFARIYRKGTSSAEEPFASYGKEPLKKGVDMLLNLFELSKEIKSFRKNMENIKEEVSTYKSSKKHNLIPTINAKQRKSNDVEIKKLEEKKNQLSQNTQVGALSIEAIVSGEVAILRGKKSKYVIELDEVETIISKFTKNKSSFSTNNFSEINEIFPNINLKKLSEIESFHKILTDNLNEEIREFVSNLENKKKMLLIDIDKCDIELNKISKINNIPTAILSKYSLIDKEINRKNEESYFYDLEIEISQKNVDAQNKYDAAVKESLQTIETKINDGIANYRKIIDSDAIENQIFPKIKLSATSYKMDFNVDRGTGSAFTTLLDIDLLLLKETKLIYIIEDSIMFKNISNQRMGNIINIYKEVKNKQIFIALDKISDYGEYFENITKSQIVLQLSDQNVLFGEKFISKT